MSDLIESQALANVTENVLILANVFRDDGKHEIASSLYRRAIALLDGMEPSETKHILLLKILESQSLLARKLTCGYPAWGERGLDSPAENPRAIHSVGPCNP